MRSRKRPFALGLGERGDEIGERGEARRCLPAFTASTAERRGKMAFAGAGRPEQMHHLGAVDELELGQRQDAVAIERGLEGEVEAGERFDRRSGAPCSSAVLTRRFSRKREFLDQQLVEGLDAVDLALLDAPQGGVEHFERARHPAAPTRLFLMLSIVVGWMEVMSDLPMPRCEMVCRWPGRRRASAGRRGRRLRPMMTPSDVAVRAAARAARTLAMSRVDAVLPSAFQNRMGRRRGGRGRGCGSCRAS